MAGVRPSLPIPMTEGKPGNPDGGSISEDETALSQTAMNAMIPPRRSPAIICNSLHNTLVQSSRRHTLPRRSVRYICYINVMQTKKLDYFPNGL